MKRFTQILGVALLVSTFAVQSSEAQERGNPNWFFRFAPYLWFSNLGGAESLGLPQDPQTVGGLIVPVEDTVLQKDFLVRTEFGKGRVRGWLNFSRAKIANPTDEIHPEDDPNDHLSGAYDLTWTTFEAFAAIQIGPFVPTHGFEAYVGGRYVKHDQTVAVEGGGTNEIKESWVEPAFGARMFAEMGGRFWTVFNSDIGGFGVGSDFTWTLGGELGFRVFGPLDISMRYNYQEVDYDNRKDGSERYVWSNGVQQGWFFGAIIKL